jgi:hypothetical protein
MYAKKPNGLIRVASDREILQRPPSVNADSHFSPSFRMISFAHRLSSPFPGMLACFGILGPLCAQDAMIDLDAPDSRPELSAPEVRAPSGFADMPEGFDGGAASVLDGWDFGATTGFYYTSNVTQGGRAGLLGGVGAGDQDDFVASVGTSARYRSGGRRWWFGGGVNLGYSQYLNNDDFSGPVYGADVSAGFQGGRVSVNGSLGFGLQRGGNRNVGGFTERLSLTGSLGANYEYSSKTSIDGRLSTDLISPQDNNGSESSSVRGDVSALWRATPLTTVGLGVAWSHQGGGNRADRRTIGPVLRLDYKASQKIALNSSFGLDFVDFSGGGGGGVPAGSQGSDISYDISLGASYQASPLWGMNLSVFGGTRPDESLAGGFRETISVRLGYNRRILRSSLNLGVSYETSSQSGSTVRGGAADRDSVGFDASLSREIPVIRGSGSVYCNWRDQSGGGGNAFDSTTVGVSLSSSF